MLRFVPDVPNNVFAYVTGDVLLIVNVETVEAPPTTRLLPPVPDTLRPLTVKLAGPLPLPSDRAPLVVPFPKVTEFVGAKLPPAPICSAPF